MRGRSMVVYVYIHRRAASDVLNLLIYAWFRWLTNWADYINKWIGF
jgi:hypothetical protein